MSTKYRILLGIIAVLIIILIIVYVRTKQAAATNAGAAALMNAAANPCANCAAPYQCINNACVDPVLPGLISAAQAAATDLMGDVNELISVTAAANAQAAKTFGTCAQVPAAQIAANSMGGVMSAIAAVNSNATALNKAITSFKKLLSADSCPSGGIGVPGGKSCGYYTDMMSITTNTFTPSIWSMEIESQTLAPGAQPIAPAIAQLIASLNQLSNEYNNFMSGTIQLPTTQMLGMIPIKGPQLQTSISVPMCVGPIVTVSPMYDGLIKDNISVLNAYISKIQSYIGKLTSDIQNVQLTAKKLKNHLLPALN
jgi:hypothetical protein